jgi:hypothetical protein
MGASSWVYYVPYQEKLEQAFQTLRQHLFETDDAFDDYFPPPQTIREGLERSEGSGTHTAMDFEYLGTRPRDYSTVPLAAEILHRFFVEAVPTRMLVEELISFTEKQAIRQIPGHESQVNWKSCFSGYDYLSEETRRFVENGPSKQEVVEALLTQETIWRDFRRMIFVKIGDLTDGAGRGMMPLSSEELVSFFGTEKPTRAAFESAEDELLDHLFRWSGFYTILYQEDGTPHEIAFLGISGD